ncbi:MAG TPA: EAL domain-containing protein [Telluria sp.]|nr:EAL domain-containing protein [Telluria sp.]
MRSLLLTPSRDGVFTLRQILMFLVGVLLLPSLVATTALAVKNFNDGVTAHRESTIQTARAMAHVVDGELAGLRAAAQALAVAPPLQQGDLAGFYDYARSVQTTTASYAVVLSDLHGQALLNTAVPFGARLPLLANRDQLERVLAQRAPVISELFYGALKQQQALSVAVPVYRGGDVRYVLELRVLPQRFSQILLEQRLDPDWIASIIDGNGTIIARTQGAERYAGHKTRADLLARMAVAREGYLEGASLEDIPVVTMFSQSPESAWTVAISIPQAQFSTRLKHSLRPLLALASLMTLLGAIVAALTARRIQTSIQSLMPLANGMGKGETVDSPPMVMKEAARLGQQLEATSHTLHEAHVRRAEAERDLRRLNAELEARIEERTAEVRRSRQLLNAIVEHIPAVIVVKHARDLSYHFCNRSAELLLGKRREEVQGKTDFDLYAPDTAAAQFAVQRRFLDQHASSIETEHRIAPLHGAPRIFNTTYISLGDPNGAPAFLLQISLDITERKRYEEQLRIVASAFDVQEAMMITDGERRIIRINRAFAEMSGYSEEQLRGQTPAVLQSGRHDAQYYAGIEQVLADNGTWQGELWNQRADGDVFPCWTTMTAIRDDAGRVLNYVAVYTDITQQKRHEEEIRRLAFFDPLTGLPNRRLLMDRLHHALAATVRSGRVGALMFIDLDNFKTLNDTLGHDKGDELLRQVAARLPACVREGDTVARLGGDEFVVMLDDISEEMDQAGLVAEGVAEKVLAALNAAYDLQGTPYTCTPSVGVTLFGSHHTSIDEVLKHADLAMYDAKAAGRNAVRFFEPQMQALISEHAALERELREALQRQCFVLYYQAQVDAHDNIVGAEALLRWRQDDGSLIAPEAFIELAEETGLILAIGQWVLRTACQQLAEWATHEHMQRVTLAVNVSARQFQQPDFVEQVIEVLRTTGADTAMLKLEITESSLLRDVDEIAEKIDRLRRLGLSIALDDFGVGYSSLSYLRRLNLDQLKIDRSFVRKVAVDPHDAAIARTIVTLAQTLGLSVVAEGVETRQQRDFLHRHGCHVYQGYLYAAAVSGDEFETLVSRTYTATLV